MPKEIEVKIDGITLKTVIPKLKSLGAKYIGKYYLRRVTFQLVTKGKLSNSKSLRNKGYYTSWIRVRSNGHKTTLTLKEQYGTGISKRFEYEIEVDNFIKTVKLLRKLLPDSEFSYIENYSEIYKIGETTISLDKWPYLPHSMEIEGKSVKEVYRLLRELDINKKPSPSLAISDADYYKIHGLDYARIKSKYKAKLEKLVS